MVPPSRPRCSLYFAFSSTSTQNAPALMVLGTALPLVSACLPVATGLAIVPVYVADVPVNIAPVEVLHRGQYPKVR